MKETIIGALIETVLGVYFAHSLEKKNKEGVGLVIAITVILVAVTLLPYKNLHIPTIPGCSEIVTTTETSQTITTTTTTTITTNHIPSPKQEFYLTDLSPYATEGIATFPFLKEYGVKDIESNNYYCAYTAYMERENGTHSMTYALNGEYSTLTYKLGVNYSSIGHKYSGSFFIYADGNLVVNETDIPATYRTKDFTLDVSGVQDLTIEMYCGGPGYPTMTDTTTSVMMIEPILHR